MSEHGLIQTGCAVESGSAGEAGKLKPVLTQRRSVHKIEFAPIGFVSNGVTEPIDEGWGAVISRLTINPEFAEGITGLDQILTRLGNRLIEPGRIPSKQASRSEATWA